jgi:hypothetical protein
VSEPCNIAAFQLYGCLGDVRQMGRAVDAVSGAAKRLQADADRSLIVGMMVLGQHAPRPPLPKALAAETEREEEEGLRVTALGLSEQRRQLSQWV